MGPLPARYLPVDRGPTLLRMRSRSLPLWERLRHRPSSGRRARLQHESLTYISLTLRQVTHRRHHSWLRNSETPYPRGKSIQALELRKGAAPWSVRTKSAAIPWQNILTKLAQSSWKPSEQLTSTIVRQGTTSSDSATRANH